MKVRAIGCLGADLPAHYIEQSGNTPQTRFKVTVGREYQVHAMALWSYCVAILVVDDTSRPNWKPVALFEVTDGRLPENWEFRLVEENGPVRALWGYHSLIRDRNHHDDLIERKRSALEAFLQETGYSENIR